MQYGSKTLFRTLDTFGRQVLCTAVEPRDSQDSTPVTSNNSAGKAAGLTISDEVVGEGPAAKMVTV